MSFTGEKALAVASNLHLPFTEETVTINSTKFRDAKAARSPDEKAAAAAIERAFATYGSQDNVRPLDAIVAKDFSRSVGIPASTRSGHVWRWSETDSDWFRHPIIRSENVICTQMGIRVGEKIRYCACCHGPTFRAHQRTAVLNPVALDDKEPVRSYELASKEQGSSRWLMQSRLPGPETVEPPAQPVTYVTDQQTGFAFGLKSRSVRHDRNYRGELNSRSKLREKARHDAGAFERELPDDILHRVLRNSDEAEGRTSIALRQTPARDIAWLRQEAAVESGWPVFTNMLAAIEAGNGAIAGDHPPPPSLRSTTLSPGLVVASAAALGLDHGIVDGVYSVVDRGGIAIALRKSDGRSRRAV